MLGMGGMNPKNMEKMMKQLGMNVDTINADEVIIKCSDKQIVIANPTVQKIKMQGTESFQISGDVSENDEGAQFSEEDISMVAEQADCSEEAAKKALEETGDIAEAILRLKKN